MAAHLATQGIPPQSLITGGEMIIPKNNIVYFEMARIVGLMTGIDNEI
jgi:hypothetical protein